MRKKTETTIRKRSPNYPAVSLPEAVTLVDLFIAKEGKGGAQIDAAVKSMGFSGVHGVSRGVVSALKKFRLVDDDAGRIVPTALALDIIGFPEDNERRRVALRMAALGPAIYKEVVSIFSARGELPDDEQLAAEFETEWNFNPKVVVKFLNDLRTTLAYAGFMDGNRLVLSEKTINRVRLATDFDSPAGATRVAATHSPASGPLILFDLPRGNVIEIRLRNKVTREEFEKVKKIFELSEFALIEDAPASAATSDVNVTGS